MSDLGPIPAAVPPVRLPGALRRRPLLVGFACLLGIVLLLWFVVWIVQCWIVLDAFGRDEARGRGDIDEAAAAAVFREHRDDCDALRQVLQDARVTDTRWQQLTGPRAQQVERLLQRIGAYSYRVCVPEQWPFTVEIELASYGNFFHRAFQAFVYVPSGLQPVDRPPVGDDPDFERFTPLGDGWFLRHYTQ
ncbi:MAG: hypothetical protein FJ265_05985 [Planctomycetes bacterium]|nr:hypothetical protein [Planctomycetota bacterium]